MNIKVASCRWLPLCCKAAKLNVDRKGKKKTGIPKNNLTWENKQLATSREKHQANMQRREKIHKYHGRRYWTKNRMHAAKTATTAF